MDEQTNETGSEEQDLSHLIPDNTHVPARAKKWDYDSTSTGKTRLRVLFELGGDYAGRHLTWDGYFSEGAFARTVESLEHMGWEGTDLSDVQGLDKNEVVLVVSQETYEGKTRNRINWVNRQADLRIFKPLDDAEKKNFANEMQGKLLLLRQGKPNNGPPRPSPAKQNGAPAPVKSLDEIPF